MPVTSDPHTFALLALTTLVFVMFASGRVAIETTALLVLLTLVGGFTFFPHSSFAASAVFRGFGHEALIAICLLMILGRGLLVTGALEPVARHLARSWARAPRLSMLIMLVACAAGSGFLNDTPIVVVMMPILVGLALRTKQSASRLLMPMNYSVLIGGMGTTIGTSTNLLVVSIASDLGLRRFELLDFLPLAATAAVPGLLYVWLVLPRLLPERGALMDDISPRIFDTWLYATEEGIGKGMTMSDVKKATAGHMTVREVLRDELQLVRLPTLQLRAGDRLLVRDTPANLKEFEAVLKFSLHGLETDDESGAAEKKNDEQTDQLAEIVVTETSPLCHHTLRSLRFAERDGLIVLGLRRAGRADVGKADDIAEIRLLTGDVLLVQGKQDALNQLKAGGTLVLDGSLNLPRGKRAPMALGIMALVVSAAAFKLAPIVVCALAGVLAMIATRCLDWDEVGHALSSKVILIVASSLALGAALTATGGTTYLAGAYLSVVRDLPPTVILSSLILLVALFTNFVSNNAAAAVGTPIAASIAAQLGVSADPFVLAVLFGANLSYATPMGYQTNLLVMNAAGYKFSDFLRGGVPLVLLMWIVYSLLLPIFFPLTL